MAKKRPFNNDFQIYKGITIQLIGRYEGRMAKRFWLPPQSDDARDNQNVWIPNKHLEEDGTLKSTENIDYVFRKSQRQLELAGYLGPIPGIKRRTKEDSQ